MVLELATINAHGWLQMFIKPRKNTLIQTQTSKHLIPKTLSSWNILHKGKLFLVKITPCVKIKQIGMH